jgi:hypothetical protein
MSLPYCGADTCGSDTHPGHRAPSSLHPHGVQIAAKLAHATTLHLPDHKVCAAVSRRFHKKRCLPEAGGSSGQSAAAPLLYICTNYPAACGTQSAKRSTSDVAAHLIEVANLASCAPGHCIPRIHRALCAKNRCSISIFEYYVWRKDDVVHCALMQHEAELRFSNGPTALD